jgi:hypothetical protein
MIAPLEKLIDWSTVQVMTLMMPAKEIAIVEQVKVSCRCQPGRPSRQACQLFSSLSCYLSLVSGIHL